MKGDMRCVEGRLYRHDPQLDDPWLETILGDCPDCSGDGCGDDGEPASKAGRSAAWLSGVDDRVSDMRDNHRALNGGEGR